MFRILHIVFLLVASLIASAQDLTINEIMSSNDDYLVDDNNESSDWIEIYNGTMNAVNLAEYYLSDDLNDLTKWSFPNKIISPGSFILVFASGRDIRQQNLNLHTNFKIRSSGEMIYLSKGGQVIHQVPEVSIEEDISYGLFPDGGSLFTYFDVPTAGKSNSQNFQVSDLLVFSVGSPMVSSGTKLKIDNTDAGYQIFYTIDGSEPSTSSLSYPNQGLSLDKKLFSNVNINQQLITPPADYNPPSTSVTKAIVIRAASFDSLGNQMSDVITKTFFLSDEQHYDLSLPIISLVLDPQDLLDNDSGIFVPGVHFDPDNVKWSGNYYQRGRDWEKEVFFEYYDFENNSEIHQYCGLRIHGDGSRKLPQKALRIYARSEYGKSWLDFPFFESNAYDEYKRLTLKPFSASWTDAGITDYLTGRLAKSVDMESLSARPVSVFLNGEYWGLYFLQERLDERYISSLSDIDEDSIDIIASWQGQITVGSNQDFLKLYDFIASNDLSVASNYKVVEEWIDIPSFVDYQLYQIFTANYDWPANNMKCWRKQEKGAKWRWVFYDGDGAMLEVKTNSFEHALDSISQGWPTNAETTLFLRKLLKNPTFFQLWNEKFQQRLDEAFDYANTSSILKDVTEEISSTITKQCERFGKPLSVSSWANEIDRFYHFLSERRCIMYAQATQLFEEEYKINRCLNIGNDIDTYVLYPNPTDNILHLQFNSDKITNAQVTIFNIMGEEVMISNIEIFPGINNYSFDFSAEISGTYIWQLCTAEETFTRKIQVY